MFRRDISRRDATECRSACIASRALNELLARTSDYEHVFPHGWTTARRMGESASKVGFGSGEVHENSERSVACASRCENGYKCLHGVATAPRLRGGGWGRSLSSYSRQCAPASCRLIRTVFSAVPFSGGPAVRINGGLRARTFDPLGDCGKRHGRSVETLLPGGNRTVDRVSLSAPHIRLPHLLWLPADGARGEPGRSREHNLSTRQLGVTWLVLPCLLLQPN